MKILILGKYFPPFEGGIEKYVYDISRKLVQEKNCVWVIVSNTEKKYSFEKIEGINLIRVPRSIYFLRGFLTPPIINIVKKINPDIIHLNVPNPWFEINILLFCIFYRKKIFITYHSDIINYTPFHA
ncbi:MAG: glycosyltransferase, partial [Candidatus Aenigmatarchaeota archaeon]